jgi:Jacalin-like lectin domain
MKKPGQKPGTPIVEVQGGLKSPAKGIDTVREYGEECGGRREGVPYRTFAPAPARLTRVTVWHRLLVDGIQLETDQGVLPRIGGTGKHRDIRKETFELERDEHLTGVTVEYWSYIDRIIFHTNKRNYGPYGGEGGLLKKSLYAPPGHAIVGFKGRHWEFIDSIQLMISDLEEKRI